ncbi:MAG: glycosyltransferase 87 family protein [Ktedonobacterales bacterium]
MNAHIQLDLRGGLARIRYRRAISRALLILAPAVALYALAILVLSFTTSFYNRPLDISVYYAAAAALRSHPGANIYDPTVLAAAARQHPGCVLWPGANYLYPPLLAVLLEPLTSLPYAQVAHYWLLGNLALWALDTALLVNWVLSVWAGGDAEKPAQRQRARLWLRGEPDRASLAAVAVVIASVLAWPVLDGALMGQINLLLLLALLWAPALVRGDHEIAAGMLLAFATMLKLLPILLIIYYLARGRWRVVGGAALGLLALTGIVLLTAGPAVLLDARAILLDSADVVRIGCNESLAQAPIWLAVALGQPVTDAVLVLGKLLLALVALVFCAGLAMGWYTRWRGVHGVGDENSGSGGDTNELLGYGWCVCAMILLSPLAWLHYNAWLLFPFILCLGYDLRTRRVSAKLLALYAVTYAVLFLPWSIGLDTNNFAAAPFLFGVGLRPFLMLLHPAGAVTLWVLIGRRYFFARTDTHFRARWPRIAAGAH